MNSQNFEIPDVCATDTRQCDLCSGIPTTACSANLGICFPPSVPSCSCHDVCVEEVRLIGVAGGNCEFTQCFSYPPIGSCRLGAGITLPIINTNVTPRVFVVCAQEVLDASCEVVNVQIQLLVLASTNSGNILIPLTLNVAFDTFFAFPNCTTEIRGNALQNALTEIDGSCLVIQLRAFFQPVASGTTQIIITGRIVDKLWKHENLWIEGIRPYELNAVQRAQGFVSFTIPDIFNNTHRVGPCVQLPCP